MKSLKKSFVKIGKLKSGTMEVRLASRERDLWKSGSFELANKIEG